MPINGIIPAQNFKVVRDKIGAIIALEFANQYTLTSDPDYHLSTSIGRSTPIDHSEMPFINILTGAMSLDSQDLGASDNTVTYYLDFYAKAKATSDNLADINAETILLKLIGTGRAILENPIYKTLDFAAGTIMNRHVTNIDVRDPQNLKDSVVTMSGRLTFVVRMIETTQLLDGDLITQYRTQVKMSDTDFGYEWQNYTQTNNINALNGDNLVSFSDDNLKTFNE